MKPKVRFFATHAALVPGILIASIAAGGGFLDGEENTPIADFAPRGILVWDTSVDVPASIIQWEPARSSHPPSYVVYFQGGKLLGASQVNTKKSFCRLLVNSTGQGGDSHFISGLNSLNGGTENLFSLGRIEFVESLPVPKKPAAVASGNRAGSTGQYVSDSVESISCSGVKTAGDLQSTLQQAGIWIEKDYRAQPSSATTPSGTDDTSLGADSPQ